MAGVKNWVEVVRSRAAQQGSKIAYRYLSDGTDEGRPITYAELDLTARAIAAKLLTMTTPGQRALLLFPSGLDYICAFLGCLYAGVVAVPAYPHHSSRPKRSLPRLRSIIQDAKPLLALTTASLLPSGQDLLSLIPECGALRLISTDDVGQDSASAWRDPGVTSASLAFLQYTSGSTAEPKGVMITHGNLLHNEQTIERAFGHSAETIVVGWLPLYHDMGLIGNVLQPLYCGGQCILMSPAAFLQDPMRWLAAISRFRATTSGGPNFAYDLCATRISMEDRANLNLESWRVAYNGSEPIRPGTLERFARAFGPQGFKQEAFYPCYGLAESTLIVSGGRAAEPPFIRSFESNALTMRRAIETDGDATSSDRLVSCGENLDDQEMLIVDPDSQAILNEDRVGEIWVSGPAVAAGYWGRPKQSEAVFQARLSERGNRAFLRTGDIGFIHRNQIFVTGRLKDIIIIRGRNYSPQDIELTVEECHTAARRGSGAAFSVEMDGEERLIVAQEVDRSLRECDFEDFVGRIRAAVVENHELQVHTVAILRIGSIPKTSSGKIRRGACKEAFLNQTLNCLALYSTNQRQPAAGKTFLMLAPQTPVEAEERLGYVTSYLIEQAARVLNAEPRDIDRSKTGSYYGLDSLMAADLGARVEADLGVPCPATCFLEGQSFEQIAISLARQWDAALANAAFGQASHQTAVEKAIPASANSNGANEGRWDERNPGKARGTIASLEQQSHWLLYRLSPQTSAAYNVLACVRIKGALDLGGLEACAGAVVARHPALRTTFREVNGRLVPTVASASRCSFGLIDLQMLSEKDRTEQTRRRAAEEAERPFELEEGPLLRGGVFRISAEEHLWTLVFAHIAVDGWSLQIFLNEWSAMYEKWSVGERVSLPPLAIQYSDYARIQQEKISSSEWEAQLGYWRSKLNGPWPSMDDILDVRRPSERTFQARQVGFVIPRETRLQLQTIARESGATPFMTFLAAFKAVLFRCANLKTLIIGTSTVNRIQADTKGVIGPFTNALALRADREHDAHFTDLLREVRQNALEAYAHQEIPFDLVLRELKKHRDAAPTQPFQIVFLWQTFLKTSWTLPGMQAWLEEVNSGMSNFDLAVAFYEREGELLGSLRYDPALFDSDTAQALCDCYLSVLNQLGMQPRSKISELTIPEALEAKRRRAPGDGFARRQVAVVSTFTAEPLEAPFRFWLRVLQMELPISFAPYNQVFRQLLDPDSLLRRNRDGVNIVLIRLVDFYRHQAGVNGGGLIPATDAANRWEDVRHLVQCLKAAVSDTNVPYLICLCPSGEVTELGCSEDAAALAEMERWLVDELKEIQAVRVIEPEDMLGKYPVAACYDPHSDRIGHVPFHQDFFLALATALIRRLFVLFQPPYKVIVLDCDNTLWEGLCGEDGPLGVKLGSSQQALQNFMIDRCQAGFLIALCSKNNERDVLDVFERNSRMQLKLGHLAAWRINWNPKSENLRSLAQELQLGLDSFIFLDDNPVECAEVKAHCPEVLVIQWPGSDPRGLQFLDHVWAFDRYEPITEEDRRRTLLYEQNRQRERFQKDFPTYEEFLAGLDLRMTIQRVRPDQTDRVAQLTQRTNQFNTSMIRRTRAEIQMLAQSSPWECWVVDAADRFGDYGSVGVMIVFKQKEVMVIDTFLLSCRALGKGIEHRMLAQLGELAIRQNCQLLRCNFICSGKNDPALQFFNESAAGSRSVQGNGYRFDIPADRARHVTYVAASAARPSADSRGSAASNGNAVRIDSDVVTKIAMDLATVADIHRAMRLEQGGRRPVAGRVYEPPRTPFEETVALIFADVLRTERVGINEHFFELGGDSLQGTILLSRLIQEFQLELALENLFGHPTVASLANLIEERLISELDSTTVSDVVRHLRKGGENGQTSGGE